MAISHRVTAAVVLHVCRHVPATVVRGVCHRVSYGEWDDQRVFCFASDYKCKMEELVGWGRSTDPAPVAVIGSTLAACKTACFGQVDCEAVTFDGTKCIGHKQLGVPKKHDGHTYTGKTCPKETGVGRELGRGLWDDNYWEEENEGPQSADRIKKSRTQ